MPSEKELLYHVNYQIPFLDAVKYLFADEYEGGTCIKMRKVENTLYVRLRDGTQYSTKLSPAQALCIDEFEQFYFQPDPPILMIRTIRKNQLIMAITNFSDVEYVYKLNPFVETNKKKVGCFTGLGALLSAGAFAVISGR